MLTLSLAIAGLAWLPAATRGFWFPTVLAFGGASLCAAGSLRLRKQSREPLGTRLAVIAGLTALSMVAVLGTSWPSAFTIVFLVLLPAVGFGLAALVAPALVYTKRHWSTYFAYGALIGSLCVLSYGVWLESSVSSGRVTIHDDMGDELE
jgi:hypothetical protein